MCQIALKNFFATQGCIDFSLIARAVSNTKFTNKQRLSLLYTPNETVGIKVKVEIS